jgi:benzoyl-CoA reductase/2-hydroxyglutaryl-CoA dehydratase subunit BcrC/BadD/HgdB
MRLNRHRPAPLNALDSYVHLLPLSVLRGTAAALDYYQRLEREVRERIADGVAAVPGERHRLLWDYLPVYARMRFFTRKFAHYGASFVVAPYFLTSALRVPFRRLQRALFTRVRALGWGSAHLLSWSLRYAGRAYLAQDASQPLDQRVARLARLVREYHVDGFVLHNYRSCRRFCATQYELKEALTAATGVPGVVFDADAFDSRYFSEGQVNTRIEAFMEALEQKGVGHGPAAR